MLNKKNDKNRKIIALILLVLALGTFAFIYMDMPRLAMFFLLGLVLGFVLECSDFCFISAVSNFILFKDGQQLKGLFIGLIIAVIGFGAMMYGQIPDPGVSSLPYNAHVTPLGWNILLGGFLFGFGSILAGHCVLGGLRRIGEGSVSALIVIAFVIIGMALYKINAVFWQKTLSDGAIQIWLPHYLGWALAIILTVILLAVLFFFVYFQEKKNNYISSISLKKWNPGLGGILLGVISILAYKVVQRPLGITGDIGRWADVLIDLSGIRIQAAAIVPGACSIKASWNDVTWGMLLNIGIIVGAFIVSLYKNQFRIVFCKNGRQFILSALGALIMGYGVGLAGGCNIGAFYSAIISFGLNGWVFALSTLCGTLSGLAVLQKVIYKFS